MKVRRSLAVAAAVAVATPVVLFTATPALAAGSSAAQTQNQPTYAELVKAADDAKEAYEEAVAAKDEARKKLEAALASLDSATNPLKAAMVAAEKAAEEAAGVEEAAEKAVADAEAELAAAQTDEEKEAAQQALGAAQTELAEAGTARQEADEDAEAAGDAWNDARVAAVREYSLVQDAPEKALKEKEAAEAALAAAEECVDEKALTALAVGLPSKVVAGTTVDFTLRVTNGTQRTLTVDPLAFVHVTDEAQGAKSDLLVQWSNGSGWQTLGSDGPEHIAHVDTMKPGGQSDVKLRMTVEAAAEEGDAFALFAVDASDAYNPCVLGPMKRYDFELLPAGSEPGAVDDAQPGDPGKEDDERASSATSGTKVSAQGGTSEKAAGTAATDATGNLAQTGSSSAMGPLALAGAVTVVLGAGAVVAVRRRKGTDSTTG